MMIFYLLTLLLVAYGAFRFAHSEGFDQPTSRFFIGLTVLIAIPVFYLGFFGPERATG